MTLGPNQCCGQDLGPKQCCGQDLAAEICEAQYRTPQQVKVAINNQCEMIKAASRRDQDPPAKKIIKGKLNLNDLDKQK